jgi:hypothetical protein
MRTRIGFSGRVAGGLIAGCLLAGGIAAAADAPAGERWRQTQSMEMMGMTMPARTTEFCKEAGSGDLPVKPDKNCTMHDVKRTAKGATFRMTCTGEHAAEAEGETVFLGPDHMRTKMHMKMAEGEMTMNMESQRIGPCTGNESNLQAKRMVAKAQADSARMQAEAARQQAQACADAARKAESPLLLQQCKDPETQKIYCASFQTHEPFRKQAEEEARTARSGATLPGGSAAQMLPLTTSAKLCGVDPNKVRDRLCSTAEAQGQMAFIATQCVGLARAIAARECAGRSYTSISARYQAICASFATPAAAAGATGGGPPAEGKEKKPNALSKGKKILGGLLGN